MKIQPASHLKNPWTGPRAAVSGFWFICVWSLLLARPSWVSGDAEVLDDLPASTLAVIHIPNFETFRSSFNQMWKRDANDPFAEFREAWQEVAKSNSFVRRFGFANEDLREMGDGQVALVWLPNASGLGVVICLVAEDQHAAQRVHQAIQERFAAMGYAASVVNKNNATVTSRSGPKDTTFIVSLGRQILLAKDNHVLDSFLQKTRSTLAEDSSFQTIRSKLRHNRSSEQPSRSLTWFIRPWALWGATEERPANFDLAISQGFKVIDIVGGQFTCGGRPGGPHGSYQCVLHRNGPLQKASVALPNQPVTVKTADWMTTAYDEIQAVGLDPLAVLRGYGSWFDATEGEGEAGIFDLVLEEIRDEPDGPQVDMRSQVFEQLRSPVYTLRLSSEQDVQTNAPIMAIQVKSADVVEAAVHRMFAGDPDVTITRFGKHDGGVKAWVFGDLSRGGTRQILGPDLSGVTLCVYRGWLLASRKQRTIERAIAQAEDSKSLPLSKSDRLDSVTAFIEQHAAGESSNPIAYRYSQHAEWLTEPYEQVRKGLPQTQVPGRNMRPTAIQARNFWTQILTTLRNAWVTDEVQSALNNLPPADQLRDAFHSSIDVAHVTNEGHWVIQGEWSSPVSAQTQE